ncbi:MAG: carboxypeptidase-like regulatory domain-containing protein [Crocinitomicaceae bacterium]|nr:carboxypeptidase-like regulatory domain-containing protein [Crocinitomicaceae bacterium]
MKLFVSLALLFAISFLGGCQTSPAKAIKPSDIEVTGPIEITKYSVEKSEDQLCSIQGILMDEDGEPMFGMTIQSIESQMGVMCDLDGKFKLTQIKPGACTLKFREVGIEDCIVKLNLEAGDKVNLNASIARYSSIELLKPIIYIYPEEEQTVEIELIYDGKLTTTYPKYPENGWNIEAEPDGTLTDKNGREYYSLYWEGEPREPLGITEGFVVSQEKTIEFLEEKLEILGLNAKEANEFIIFWLPVLEKNKFNLISFAGDDYLKQAKLSISPTPDTEIRICMVFQGLDEEIDFPLQDLSSLRKTRSGFTIVEWGGQELPKNFAVGI